MSVVRVDQRVSDRFDFFELAQVMLQTRLRQQLMDFLPEFVGLLLGLTSADALAVDHDLIELCLR